MSSLPGLLGLIADIAGPTVALQIAQSHGGTRVSIPPRAEDDHWLTELVGKDVADRICRGLATLDAEGRLKGINSEIIPLGPTSLLQSARRKARQALDEGRSVREAARIAGLHERTIWRMTSKDDDQGTLF
ncbi:hypothetical protein N5C66_05910 [Rhizobium pusense]|uniref:hypothetical protein n=1 Tax=Agrobacterium pusense TaxID=648995 RepID=UPI002449B510|nr:hypothetical protein [Agrobacterium pusense]MDH1097432.1 hypothetical protein [Agrobacterium pusense]MDH1111262.1 hypothetical protein [Agrobacterium pusense]MDH2193465.1 hypothetical protein [Agrobacterium pusense]